MPELRTGIVDMIGAMIGRTDSRLLAYAVMPNHLHIILRQGRSTLGTVMQPLLRRVAHRVQKHHGFEGAVFERRYRDRPCRTPDHVREALMYTHLNPWRAGLCDDDLGYPWMTQRAYLPGTDPSPFGINPRSQLRVLELFGLADSPSRDQLCRDYAGWLAWRMGQARSADAEPGQPGARPAVSRPDASRGDGAWQRHFATRTPYEAPGPRQLLADLRDFVADQLILYSDGCRVQDLRGRRIPRRLVALRRRVLKAAAERGYRTGDIARFFDISPATVSIAKYAPDDGPEAPAPAIAAECGE